MGDRSHRLGEIAVGVWQRTRRQSRERCTHSSRGSARERSLCGRWQHALERVKQIFFVEWVTQKGERTRLQGLRLLTPLRGDEYRGDEYDGNARALRNQTLLQLQSAHFGKVHIQDQARGSPRTIGAQELGGGRNFRR